jgi:UDP-3-O-[3-hydroxymyristoyl] glucosamine N-acyltransferase
MTTTHDFGFGSVPAHQHTHGGGWVADTAYVGASAYVGPDVQVRDEARICGNARVCDNALVCGNARVCDNAQVYGNARVFGACSRTPIYVAVGYGVTICDDLVTFGCTTDTVHGWRTRQNWTRDPDVCEYADLLLAMAERHQDAKS